MNYLNYPLLNANTYSTEEQMIGVYYNGKPIYRILFKFTNTNTSTTNHTNLIDLDIEDLIKAYGSYISGINCVPVCAYTGPTYGDNDFAGVFAANGWLKFRGGTATQNNTVTIVAEYTKRSDKPLVSNEEILSAYLKDLPQSDLETLASVASKTLFEKEDNVV